MDDLSSIGLHNVSCVRWPYVGHAKPSHVPIMSKRSLLSVSRYHLLSRRSDTWCDSSKSDAPNCASQISHKWSPAGDDEQHLGAFSHYSLSPTPPPSDASVRLLFCLTAFGEETCLTALQGPGLPRSDLWGYWSVTMWERPLSGPGLQSGCRAGIRLMLMKCTSTVCQFVLSHVHVIVPTRWNVKCQIWGETGMVTNEKERRDDFLAFSCFESWGRLGLLTDFKGVVGVLRNYSDDLNYLFTKAQDQSKPHLNKMPVKTNMSFKLEHKMPVDLQLHYVIVMAGIITAFLCILSRAEEYIKITQILQIAVHLYI